MEISNLANQIVSKVKLGDPSSSGGIQKVLGGGISLKRGFLFEKKRVTQGNLTSGVGELGPEEKEI